MNEFYFLFLGISTASLKLTTVIFFHEDIPCEGEKPTPEELLAYLCLRIFFCDLLKNP